WLPDDLLKAEIVLWYAERSRTYENYQKILGEYGSFLTTENHRERMNAVSARLYQGKKGEMAADFTYPDRNGKLVSLSDFRGKVVLVDGATVVPAGGNPHLVKLEKEREGKDVVFIGVSIDQKKDHRKWLEVLEQEGLSGVQLFAGVSPQIMKDYKFTTIPRFMVFDREGKVVTTNSPRPSSPELKKLLEKLLNSGL
ncbi:MAG: peroxiredoxin family protein, partial [Odoribacter splanchnicus]